MVRGKEDQIIGNYKKVGQKDRILRGKEDKIIGNYKKVGQKDRMLRGKEDQIKDNEDRRFRDTHKRRKVMTT